MTKTSHVIRGLTDGTEYAVRVIANRDDADSGPSSEVTATPAETTPPELSSASVDGATLTLTFDEQLDTGEAPDRAAFTVTVAGSGRGVDTVAVSGSMVTLTLVTAVAAGEAVTLDYTAPTGDTASKLKDLAGNAAASFSGQDVTNDTAPEQPLEPSQTERSPQGELDILGSPTGLQVARHGSGKLVASWIAPDTGPVPTGYTVRWKESGDDWADWNDVSEAHITNGFWHIITGLTDGTEYAVRVIANRDDADSDPSSEVTATPAETTPPQLSSASVDGATLTLTFDEQLDTGEAPDRAAFTVTVAGSGRGVDTVAVSGSMVTLILVTDVAAGDTVTVDYTAPTGESAVRLQDLSGNAAASFSGPEVTNETAPPEAPLIPNDLQVTRHESGKLVASWIAPDTGPVPTGYTVQWKESGDDWADQDDVSEAVVAGTSHTITGLTDGTEYAVRVIANRDDADSGPSGEVAAIPQETTPPELSSASVDGAELTLTFDEALNTVDAPETSVFAVTVAGGSRGVQAVTVSGSAATLTLVTAVVAGDAVTVDYTAPAGESESRLQDQVGNAAASFSGQSVTNDTQAAVPPTASTHDVPANHDGSSAFTFELRFSEEPADGFSYKTLRDHSFTVTGGEVVHVRRLEAGKNVRWEISVTPSGDGPVTIVLPATTDCEADGAVCTDDGRKLSPGLEFEVPGLSAPEITSGSSFSLDEGSTEVATLRATDGDTPAANLTWSVSGGDDETKFAVTAAGVLSFAAARDYETPDDADTDGVYEVTVQVSDGGRTDSADLTVTLTNVNEAPTADAGSDQADVEQGTAVTLSGSGTDPDSGDTLSYAWTQSGTPAVTLSDSAVASPTFTAPTGLSADTNLTFTLRVTDARGLYAEDSVTVTINGQLPLTPLTASAHGVAAAHDGSTTFTFELRFSETPREGFSYKTLRDHAFTVTGGEVVKVRRLEAGKNVRWEISVTPSGDGPVTIVLPATTDCDADGAVCTDDGRMLSSRLEITVPGP